MPPRKTELPEGTDHIINGAMEMNTGNNTGTGVGGGGGTSSGFIGSSDTAVLGDDTGGTTIRGTASGSSTKERAVSQIKSGAQDLRQQAVGKVREYAEDGKSRATTALDDFSSVIRDTADQIDERLGGEYGQYARRAADAVQDFSRNIGEKSVDDLYDDARELVRKSPVAAIGIAAAVGFALVRLVKAGIPEQEVDVDFEPDPKLGTDRTTGTPPSVNSPTGV